MKAETVYTEILKRMPMAVAVMDSSSVIRFRNLAFARMFGTSEIRQNKFTEVLDPEVLDAFLGGLSALSASDLSVYELNCRYVNASGDSDRWMHCNVLALSDTGEERLFYAIINDISGHMDENLRLRREKELAEQSTRTKSAFLANMSHEIRTPIHTVTGMTELLLDTTLDDEQEEYIKQIRFSAEVLLGLINDILDFSKIEAGKLSLEIIDFDPGSTIEEAVDMQCLEAFKKGLEILLDMDPKLPKIARGDPVRLRQIITNLLSNAIKFTKTGEISVSVRVEENGPDFCRVRCEVSDTGIGIPPEKRDLLFQAFSQVDASMTRRFGGTGLGLSICRSLISLMQGEIGVTSAAGKGSTFWFTIPFPFSTAEAPKSTLPPPDFCADRRVLIVDDNSGNRRIMRNIMQTYCSNILEAENGAMGLQMLRTASDFGAPFDIAMVDLQMPGIDGWQFASEVNADKKINGTRMFLMSPPGKMGGEAKMKLLNWFDDYISKPIKTRELLEVLSRSLRENLDLSVAEVETEHEQLFPPDADGKEEISTLEAVPFKILVAEDHFVNQKLFQTILERLGHSVSMASNGKEAVATALSENPDMIFMDVQMPEMNGYEATVALRQSGYGAPIIAVTANALKGDLEECLNAGMNDYIAKPFQRIDVEKMIRKWMESQNSAQDVPKAMDSLGPVFNFARALEAFLQDRETLTTVLRDFIARTPQQFQKIRTTVENGDFKSAELEAHTIKGSSWNLGISRVGGIAAKLELACRNGETENSRELLEPLEKAWDEFVSESKKYL